MPLGERIDASPGPRIVCGGVLQSTTWTASAGSSNMTGRTPHQLNEEQEMSKLSADPAAALQDVLADGMTIAVGGFGLSGIPADLIDAVRDSGVRDLTIVSNNMGVDGKGLGVLIESGQ